MLKTVNPIQTPSFCCLPTSSAHCPGEFLPKSTFLVLLYTTIWNDQGQAFAAVTSFTDAHRCIGSNRLVCISSIISKIRLIEDKRLVSGITASMLLPMQTKMSKKHCISLVHGLYLVKDGYIKLDFSVAVRGQFICNFLHNPTVSFEFWTIFLVWFLNLEKPTRAISSQYI